MLTIKNGWVNDPNGLVKVGKNYHLYFQYLPGSSRWKLGIGWGHATSTDLKTWKVHKKRVLFPSTQYDRDGCFSGSTSIINNHVYALYTGVVETNGKLKEYQCLASSDDGKSFVKCLRPIISKPPSPDVHGWRDPFLFKYNDTYYMLIGSGWNNTGHILLYKGDSEFPSKSWAYMGSIISKENEIMLECPFIWNVKDDLWIIGASCDGANPVYWTGNFDGSTFSVKYKKPKLLKFAADMDAYAPTIVEINNKPCFLTWLRNSKSLYGPYSIDIDESGKDLKLKELDVTNA